MMQYLFTISKIRLCNFLLVSFVQIVYKAVSSLICSVLLLISSECTSSLLLLLTAYLNAVTLLLDAMLYICWCLLLIGNKESTKLLQLCPASIFLRVSTSYRAERKTQQIGVVNYGFQNLLDVIKVQIDVVNYRISRIFFKTAANLQCSWTFQIYMMSDTA